MRFIEIISLLIGRALLGIYFILPGMQKISGYQGSIDYMTAHNVPLIDLLLPLTIVIQLSAGIAIILGYQGKLAALVLAGLTLVISLYMHNFWAMAEGLERTHELQNFFKNMGIMAGLLVMSSLGAGPLSLDSKLQKD
jgi:putative oxidoreductase